MRYERIIRRVLHEPWLITRAGHESMVTLLESKLANTSLADINQNLPPSGSARLRQAARPKEDLFGDPLPQMEIDRDRIATIPIYGVIGAGLGLIEKSCGAVDTGDVGEDIDAALAAGVRGIILDIDSPGGMVCGTPELGEKIARIQEDGEIPIYTYARQCCSAAYWIAAGCNGIFGTTSSDVGSIGVYMAMTDRSKSFEMMGYKVELIKAGRLKGIGYPGTSLSAEQRAYLQDDIDGIYNMFTSHVRAYRGNIADDTMQGQSFMGHAAAACGLLDDIITNISDIKQRILK